MNVFLLLGLAAGELCERYPLETARAVVRESLDWPTAGAAAWFTADPSRDEPMRLACCEVFGRDIGLAWPVFIVRNPDSIHGVLMRAWGFNRGHVTRDGCSTHSYDYWLLMTGVPKR